MPVNYDPRWPSIADLRARARRRLPGFAYDYLDAAIDEERGLAENRAAFHRIRLIPRYLRDVGTVDLSVRLFDADYQLPFGAAPIGLGNMMWPGAERSLAQACEQARMPYIQSTFSTTLLEEIAAIAPNVCWYQLYVPRDEAVMRDLIGRVREAGFKTLVVTLDIPVGAKRNRELKNALQLPFRPTLKTIWQAGTHPRWLCATLLHGMPYFVNVARYQTRTDQGLAEFITGFTMSGATPERLRLIRKLWDGPLVLKGIQHPADAQQAHALGADGLIISNHGGRQLDAAPASLESLWHLPSTLRERLTLMLDSGIRSGLDIARARALGAEAVFSGRGFFFGLGAMGRAGAVQVREIYRDELTRTLQQLGATSFKDLNTDWVDRQTLPGGASE